MFVTKEILEKYNACESGKKLFDRLYPNGVEINTLLDNRHIPLEVLHWGAEFLPVSDNELEKYYKRINVINCEDCQKSYNIQESKHIYRCSNVENSEFVKLSSNIVRSNHITNCQHIEKSELIKDSSDINNCDLIINGKTIRDSYNIANSSDIRDCQNLSNCRNLMNCHTLYNSTLCENSGFSSFLMGCHKVLFCSSISAQSFMLFNKPISKRIFDNLWEDFLNRMNNEHIDMIMINSSNLYFEGETQHNFQIMFNSLSDDFKKWIKTLPNYDNFVMYEITFDEFWLN